MDASNTGESRRKNRGQFTKGDPRIWKKGRPRSFDAVRELAQAIAHEPARDKTGNALVTGSHTMTIAETILRQWAQSKNPILQKAFMEIAFGKVPDEIKNDGSIRLIVTYDDKLFNQSQEEEK